MSKKSTFYYVAIGWCLLFNCCWQSPCEKQMSSREPPEDSRLSVFKGWVADTLLVLADFSENFSYKYELASDSSDLTITRFYRIDFQIGSIGNYDENVRAVWFALKTSNILPLEGNGNLLLEFEYSVFYHESVVKRFRFYYTPSFNNVRLSNNLYRIEASIIRGRADLLQIDTLL